MTEKTKRQFDVAHPVRFGGKHYPAGGKIWAGEDDLAHIGAYVRLPEGAQPSTRDEANLTEEKVREMCEEHIARAKADLEAAQKLRDAAADDAFKAAIDRDLAEGVLAKAQTLSDQATVDRTAAEQALAEAKELSEKAAADRKAAEKAAKK